MTLIFFIYCVFIFLLGLCVGSFLNCVIYRLETKKTLKGRSFCPHCKKQLETRDLIPVFSFLALKGKCRNCKKNISWQYPIVELATGIVFLLTFLVFNSLTILNLINLVFLFYIFSAMIVIFVYDLKHFLIPDKVLIPAIIITFVYIVCSSASQDFGIILNHLLASFIGFSFFFTIFAISKGQWMGFGDVKFAILMGLLLGLPNTLLALFLAFFFGAIIGVILMIFGKKGIKSEIQFGPFLIFGSFLAALWGTKIINWYLNLFIQ